MGGIFFLLLSAGIKYITAPLIVLFNNKFYKIALLFQLLILTYLSIKMEIQPWYFYPYLFFFLFFQNSSKSCKFSFGLLISYYPYIRLGGWDTAEKVNLKHQIITTFLIVNLLYFAFLLFRHWSHLHIELKKSDT